MIMTCAACVPVSTTSTNRNTRTSIGNSFKCKMDMDVNISARSTSTRRHVHVSSVSSVSYSSCTIFLLFYLSSCVFWSSSLSSAHALVPYRSNDSDNNYDINSHSHSHKDDKDNQEVRNLINANANIDNGNGTSTSTSLSLRKIKPPSPHLVHHHKLVINFPINDHCKVDVTLTKVLCVGLRAEKDLPVRVPYFLNVVYAEFLNISSNANLTLQTLHEYFPNVVHLVVTRSPGALRHRDRDGEFINTGSDSASNLTSYYHSLGGQFTWGSVRQLNLSWNQLTSDVISNALLHSFPNVELMDISHNFVAQAEFNVGLVPNLKYMDISGNPLDCTSDLYWLDNHNIELLHPDQTLCDLPPHQNKAKPIWKVIRLIKKVREECKVKCSCDIAYIWEQNHVIHSKTTVNCSNRGFTEFPDPELLPNPTDTLDLSGNEISSIKKFVEDERYTNLHVMNLYLDSNKISSINLLEGSEWFYNFQVFTIRNNSITEVPVYVLENVFSHNKRILQIDLSLNSFNCECITVSTLKIWLLKYASNIKDIEDVRCFETGEQIRYMRREDWCTIEYSDGEQLIDILDIVSIFLAVAIIIVIGKVYYDYWNFKHKGKLPWLVRKM